MAATVPVESAGQTSPLLEQAMSIGEPTEPSTQDTEPSRVEPAPGTYESFMSSFGSPARWAR